MSLSTQAILVSYQLAMSWAAFWISVSYDFLITMTDMVMHLHDLGWFVVRVHIDSITLQRDFGTDGSEVLLNITIEV